MRSNGSVANDVRYTGKMSTVTRPGLRQRRRTELVEEVLSVAGQHLQEHGSGNLSLRAVAREIGIAPSALYRYFPSRDDLLTALIARTFTQIARILDVAVEDALTSHPGDPVAAWTQATGEYRQWALTHRGEFALVYGTPIPGYAAPEKATREVGRNSSLPLFRIILHALQHGTAGVEAFDTRGDQMTARMRSVMADDARSRGLDIPEEARAAGLMALAYGAWSALQGLVAMELFDHLPAIHPYADEFFNTESAAIASRLITFKRPL